MIKKHLKKFYFKQIYMNTDLSLIAGNVLRKNRKLNVFLNAFNY